MSAKSEIFYSILKGDSYDLEFLNSLLNEYPWFSMAAALMIRDLKDVGDDRRGTILKNLYSLSFTANPYSGVNTMLRTVFEDKNVENNESIDIINSFLDKKVGRIKISDKEPINVVSEYSETDIVTEQFAKILLSQGNKERAKEIYRKLSLKNPEKSVYFALQIENIDKI